MKDRPLLLGNATYLDERMKFCRGDILIDDDGIIRSIEASRRDGPSGQSVFDCSDYLLLPGLINSHFHSQSTLLRGLSKEIPLEEWGEPGLQGRLQNHFFHYLDEEATEEEIRIICMNDFKDLLKQGVTYCSDSGTGEFSPIWTVDAMDRVGIRGIVDAYDSYVEVAGSNPPDSLPRFTAHLPEEEDITEDELASALAIRERYDPIFMTHSLETEWRRDMVMKNWQKSSVELFAERGLLSEKVVLFHGVCMTDADIERVARHGSSIVHCPISNLAGGGIAPLDKWIRKGIHVAIGTDWSRTDIWEVIRLAYYLLKRLGGVRFGSAETVFEMATVNGAKAYGIDHRIGRIAAGYQADIVFVRGDDIVFTPVIDHPDFSNRVHNLLMEGRSSRIRHVMVDGKWVIREGRLETVNEDELETEYRRIMARILENAPGTG